MCRLKNGAVHREVAVRGADWRVAWPVIVRAGVASGRRRGMRAHSLAGGVSGPAGPGDDRALGPPSLPLTFHRTIPMKHRKGHPIPARDGSVTTATRPPQGVCTASDSPRVASGRRDMADPTNRAARPRCLDATPCHPVAHAP